MLTWIVEALVDIHGAVFPLVPGVAAVAAVAGHAVVTLAVVETRVRVAVVDVVTAVLSIVAELAGAVVVGDKVVAGTTVLARI